ncbi:MAG TPA: zinc-ribbon and DUF3426 domain-containing protein [Ramlibacter sp.]|nr:zinc-ribbon and DUF3426 domain-containing protein [Ramlibacter sp.]
MSLTTRCPACGTLFRVVPDQLRISAGWVRCGQCAEVFDASSHLQPLVSAQAPSLGTLESASAIPQAAERPEALPIASADKRLHPDFEDEPAKPTPKPEGGFVAGWDADGTPDPAGASDADLDSHISVTLRRADAPDDDEADRAPAEPLKYTARREAPVSAPAPAIDPLDSVSFVQEARRRERWSRRDLRSMSWLGLAGLVLVLLAQMAVHHRDKLAMQLPEFRPALEWLCVPLSCSINAPRQIESVVIDASGFQRLRPDAYRLTVTLRNQASIDLAMPAFELTLTDTQDQPVLRRVLLPAEIAGAPALIGASGDWSGALTVAVAPGVAAGRVAGYRLLAFYP